jgi:DNA-directed RNA polymerase beta subunit
MTNQTNEVKNNIIKVQNSIILEKIAYLKASNLENEIKAQAIRELRQENKMLRSLLFFEGKRN